MADTPEERVRARGKEMVRNAVGISECNVSGQWRMRYHWGGQYGKSPGAFFDSGQSEWWYWPADGFVHDGHVYIVLRKVRGSPGKKMFPFEMFGAVLARVSNLDESPEKWKVEYIDLIGENADDFAATAVVEGDYVYFFNVANGGREFPRPLVLARAVLEKLDDMSSGLEYLAKDRSWKRGYDSGDALAIFADGHSEMSIRYHDAISRWVAVTQGPEFLSKRIMIRTAPDLRGPWGDPVPVFSFPETASENPTHDPDTFCYAVKEQTQFIREDKLLITYVCNSFDFDNMLADMEIYRPQPIWIPLPNPDADGSVEEVVGRSVER